MAHEALLGGHVHETEVTLVLLDLLGPPPVLLAGQVDLQQGLGGQRSTAGFAVVASSRMSVLAAVFGVTGKSVLVSVVRALAAFLALDPLAVVARELVDVAAGDELEVEKRAKMRISRSPVDL